MWEKKKNLVNLHVKLSILSIGGATLIFINTTKCPTKSLNKKWNVVLSGGFVCSYSLLQYKREQGGYLLHGTVQEETDTERLFTNFQRFCDSSK